MKKICIVLLCFVGSLQAQSLLQDAALLTDACKVLADTTADRGDQAAALGQLTAILWYYDQDRRALPEPPSLGELVENYSTNNTIAELIGELNLDMPATTPPYMAALNRTREQLTSGPREKILQLLYAEQAMDPADYLSLLKTVREYQEPPMSTLSAMQAPASAANQSNNGGSLFSQEAIIRGLFSFLIQRAGEELVVTFLDRLLGKEMSTVAELFPTVLTMYKTTDYAYSDSFLANLQDAFLQDFQLLDVRLPELLLTNDLFAELQADPVFYNLLTVYTVAAITRDQDVPIDEAVPLVSRNLYQRYQDTEKERNLMLAQTATASREYREVVNAVQAVVDQASLIYADIDSAETNLQNRVFDFSLNGDIPFPIRMQAQEAAEMMKDNGQRFANIFEASGPDGYDLNFVPSLLEGELPQSLVALMGTLESYDRFFREPTTPLNRRAAGLALARRLTGLEYGTTTLDQYFLEWRDNLVQFDNRMLVAEVAAQSAEARLQARQNNINQAKVDMATTIADARAQWSGVLNSDEANALIVLGNILDELATFVPVAGEERSPVDELRIQESRLRGVKGRLFALHDRIEARLGPDVLQPDPIAAFGISPTTTEPLGNVLNKSLELRKRLLDLRTALDNLDQAFAANLSRSHDNAKPLLQIGEVLSNLMFLLRTNDATEQRFISFDELQEVLLSKSSRSAFLGLLEQELGHVQTVGLFSRDGLGFLVQSTVQDLSILPGRMHSTPDSLKFYQQSSFVVHTLNRLLQTPLLVSFEQPDSVFALVDRFPRLARVPEISNNVLDLIYYVSTDNYRKAISKTLEATIRLTAEAEDVLGGEKPTARNGLVNFLQQYGPFIGGLVDADSAAQVHALLEAFADPPGSSRVKRQRPFTVGLNAYVGGLVGGEWLAGNSEAAASSYFTAAPHIPVGITTSFLAGNKFARKRPSYSLFVSILDVGALATYNLSGTVPGDNRLTFRNILKPGLQFHWNIPKSPFYLGVGGQYGPHYREFNGELEEQRSVRAFLSFGIDIVIKRFY